MENFRLTFSEFSYVQNLLKLTDPSVEQRGAIYFQEDRVREVKKSKSRLLAKVEGGELYDCVIDLKKESFSCTCPSPTPCKHLVAVVFHIITNRDDLVDFPDGYSEEEASLGKSGGNRSLGILVQPDLQNASLYTVDEKNNLHELAQKSDILKLAHEIEDLVYEFTTRYTYSPLKYSGLQPASYKLSYIAEYFLAENLQAGRHIRWFFGDSSQECQFGCVCPVKVVLQKQLVEDEIHFVLQPYFVSPASGEKIFPRSLPQVFDGNYTLHLQKNKGQPAVFYVLQWPSDLCTLWQRFNQPVEVDEIFSLEALLKIAQVEGIEELFTEVWEAGPALAISIYPVEGGEFNIEGRLEFVYAASRKTLNPSNFEIETEEPLAKKKKKAGRLPELANFAPFPVSYKKAKQSQKIVMHPGSFLVRRSRQKEQRLLANTPLPFKYKKKTGELTLGPRILKSFLLEKLPQLRENNVIIRVHDSLLALLGNLYRVSFEIQSSSGINWFDARLQINGLTQEDMRILLEGHRRQQEFVQVSNGSWLRLDDTGLNELLQSLGELGLEVSADGQVHEITAGQLAALQMEQAIDARSEAGIGQFMKNIRLLESEPPKTLPALENFQGELREYQKQGVAFLYRLQSLGIGGILADDMGLGKTIQSLAFLNLLYQANKKCLFLVVGPMASLSVWQQEAQKFAPHLPVQVWHGTERRRQKIFRQGLIVTSYGTLLQDEAELSALKLTTVLVDEAQSVKNVRSRAARALRSLQSKTIFCLTGTPVENYLTDLWALMDLSFPGLLGTRNAFQEYYGRGTKITDPERLRRKIRPFILRRTKTSVLTELPAKTETNILIPLADEQMKLYAEERQKAIESLALAGDHRLVEMLTYLTRLRRISCHPHLEDAANTDPLLSGKIQYLADVLEELYVSSSGVLIFSQFTDLLTVTGRLLESAGHDYFYIDGQTPAKKRTEQVKDFQSGQKHFFLISLKAGGTALTLHRADTVIHLDPWWNPAAEKQAADRSHRYGQQRPVIVYRYIAQNTVEEKVLKLQEQKRELFESLFGEHMPGEEKLNREFLLSLLD